MNDFIFKFHYREKPFQFVLSVKKKKKKKRKENIQRSWQPESLHFRWTKVNSWISIYFFIKIIREIDSISSIKPFWVHPVGYFNPIEYAITIKSNMLFNYAFELTLLQLVIYFSRDKSMAGCRVISRNNIYFKL